LRLYDKSYARRILERMPPMRHSRSEAAAIVFLKLQLASL
jgi:hypothetical protein